MTAREFAYWLQGMIELTNPAAFDERQTALIKAHLAMVFTHEIDPSYPEEQQEKLNTLHQQGQSTFPSAPGLPSSNSEDIYRC